jgi:hypothetical protein
VRGLHAEYGDDFVDHKSKEFPNKLSNCRHFVQFAQGELVLILSYKVNSFAIYAIEIRALILEF